MAYIDTGRPPIISPEHRALILDAISKNLPYKFAAWFAKIHERTLYRWLEQGLKDIEDGVITEYSELRQSIKELEARKVTAHLESLEDQSERWQARAWLLERRWREDFTDKASEIEFRERIEELEKNKGEHKDG